MSDALTGTEGARPLVFRRPLLPVPSGQRAGALERIREIVCVKARGEENEILCGNCQMDPDLLFCGYGVCRMRLCAGRVGELPAVPGNAGVPDVVGAACSGGYNGNGAAVRAGGDSAAGRISGG